MARRVRDAFRKLPNDVRDALVDTGGMTSTGAYNRLTRKHLKAVTPVKTIRRMAKAASKKSGVPIIVTKDMAGKNYADGVAPRWVNTRTGKMRVEVRLHPILKYSHRTHVADVINHELDHAEVSKRVIKHRNRR